MSGFYCTDEFGDPFGAPTPAVPPSTPVTNPFLQVCTNSNPQSNRSIDRRGSPI